MKKYRRLIWGTVFVIAAVLLALDSLNVIAFTLFFDGWWTLLIIIPSFVDLIVKRDKLSSLFWLAIGVFLLLCCQDILSFDLIAKLWFPVLIAYIGIKMIVSSARKNSAERVCEKIKDEGRAIKESAAVFGGSDINFDGQVFDGADLTACFGGIKCDLRSAIIDGDCVIKVSAAFGGIDILVPDDVKIINNVSTVFGGVDVKKSNSDGKHTVYVDGIAAFGGVDIK